jgi:hypothetical protein
MEIYLKSQLNHYLTKLNLSSRCSQVQIFSSCLKCSDFLLMLLYYWAGHSANFIMLIFTLLYASVKLRELIRNASAWMCALAWMAMQLTL